MDVSNEQLPIRFSGATHPHRWHWLGSEPSSCTWAMGTHSGVLVRVSEADGVSMVHIDDCVLLQRWSIRVAEAEHDEGEDPVPARIIVEREIDIMPTFKAPDARVAGCWAGGKPRWVHADSHMPMPTEAQIRDYVAGLKPDDTVTALTREVLRLQIELAEALTSASDEPVARWPANAHADVALVCDEVSAIVQHMRSLDPAIDDVGAFIEAVDDALMRWRMHGRVAKDLSCPWHEGGDR